MYLKDIIKFKDTVFLDDNICLIKNFLPDKEFNFLLEKSIKSVDQDFVKTKDKYSLNVPLRINSSELTESMQKAIYEILPGNYTIRGFENINRTIPGGSMFLHNDNERELGIEYGFTYYINDDFLGGEIFYPHKNIYHKPIKNSMIIHIGTVEYSHSVLEVLENNRFTMTAFGYTNENPEIYAKRREKHFKRSMETMWEFQK